MYPTSRGYIFAFSARRRSCSVSGVQMVASEVSYEEHYFITGREFGLYLKANGDNLFRKPC